MNSDDRPTNPNSALRASFEQGCRDLNDRLNIGLGLLTKRIDHAYHEWSTRDAHFASLANLLVEDFGHATGLLEQLPNTQLTDNARFIEVIDGLGTPEAKYLARQLGRQKELAHNIAHNIIVKGSGPIRASIRKTPIQAENENVGTGEQMPFHDPLSVLRLLLEKERDLFSAKDRKALSDRIEVLDGPEKECNSIRLKLDIIANSLEPLYALAEQLGELLKIFKQLNEETDRLSKLKIGITRLEDETTTEDHDAQALRIDRPQLAMEAQLRELEGKLNLEKAVLAQNEAVIKEHFALEKRLMPAIEGILNYIQLLCGDPVRINIEDISEGDIECAKQGLTRARTNLPESSILSGIPPDLVDRAFTFLKEHDCFLVAYNRAKKARRTIAGIEIEILAAQDRIIDKEKDARATTKGRTAERKHHNARLEKTAEEAEDEIEQVTANLFEELEKLRTGAGIADPLDRMEPDRFWTDIEKGFGCGALEDAKKALDAIEPIIHKLDMRIS